MDFLVPLKWIHAETYNLFNFKLKYLTDYKLISMQFDQFDYSDVETKSNMTA